MGFFKTLFNAIMDAAQFHPDFSKSEYDNWLEFLSRGGTTKEWNELKKRNNWAFKESETEIYQRYQKEVKKVSDMYFSLLQEIQKEWSLLYNQKQFTGARSNAFEKMCLDDIVYYKKMREIDIKYGEKTPVNVPAFTRLAMLYEKQEQFEKAAAVCLDALKLGIDESSRLLRMIKRSERLPTEEETLLIEQHLRG
jgi:hypothetical protein